MEIGIPYVIFVLSIAIIALSIIGVVTVSLKRASYSMVFMATCLTLIFVAYAVAVDNHYLFVWAGLYAVSRILLLPFFKGGLLYTARRMPPPRIPQASIWGTMIFAGIGLAVMLFVGASSSFCLVLSSQPLDHFGEPVNMNAVLAAFMVLYGVTVLVTHRHPFKMVLGVLFMEAGILMSLVQMVPQLLSIDQIGFLFKFVGSIFMILWINRLIVERLKITDTSQLSDLKH